MSALVQPIAVHRIAYPVPSRLTCWVEDCIAFEAEVGEFFETGVFVLTQRSDLQYTGTVRLSFHTGLDAQVVFEGQVATWVRGRGVRVEAHPDTPADIFRIFAAWSVGRTADLTEPEGPPPAEERRARTRLLVIDDDRNILKMMQRRLARAGCSVMVSDAPAEALEQVSETRFDAVVMDWMLPKIPGQDLLRALREQHPHLPIAVMSGSLIWDDAVASLRRAGASEVFSKPVDFGRLLAWLASVGRPQLSCVRS